MPTALAASASTESALVPAVQSPAASVKSRTPAHLVPYLFQRGSKPAPDRNGHVGRPRGSKSYTTVLNNAAPLLAKAYVRAGIKGNAAVLVDSRKVFVPVEADGLSDGKSLVQIVFTGNPLREVSAPAPSDALASPEVSSLLQP